MQYDFGAIDPLETSGPELIAHLNLWRDALNSLHLGAARPSYAKPGMLWLKEVSLSSWEVYLTVTPEVDVKVGTVAPGTPAWQLNTGVAALAANLFLQKASPAAILDALAAGQNRTLLGRTNGSPRWGFRLGDAAAEAGSNAGSVAAITSYDDSGAELDTALSVARDTGIVTFAEPPRVALNPTNNDDLARLLYVASGDHWDKFADIAITSVAEIEATWADGAYHVVRAHLINCEAATHNAGFNMNYRVRRGATWLTTTVYTQSSIYSQNGTVGSFNQNGAAGGITNFGSFVASSAPVSATFTLLLNGVGLNVYGHTRSLNIGDNAGVATNVFSVRGERIGGAASEQFNGVRFYWGSGSNFAAQGRIIFEGLKA